MHTLLNEVNKEVEITSFLWDAVGGSVFKRYAVLAAAHLGKMGEN